MTETKCLYPECVNDSYTRGLCMKHYRKASRYVTLGIVTWEKLESSGKSSPRKRVYNVEHNWFLEGVK